MGYGTQWDIPYPIPATTPECVKFNHDLYFKHHKIQGGTSGTGGTYGGTSEAGRTVAPSGNT